MSFEGYHQLCCARGHWWDEPYTYGQFDVDHCSTCGLPPVINSVIDTTNDDGMLDENYMTPTQMKIKAMWEMADS